MARRFLGFPMFYQSSARQGYQQKHHRHKPMVVFKVILTLAFTALLFGCNDRVASDENLLLDCLLTGFIKNYPYNSDDVIIVSESQGWTDTSSILIFSYCSRKYLFRESDFLQTEIDGQTILYRASVLPGSTDSVSLVFDESRRVRTSLVWTDFKTEGLPSELEMMVPPYNPPSVQIIVDNIKQCLDTALWNDKAFRNSCTSCW
jgi:hypothetical protein